MHFRDMPEDRRKVRYFVYYHESSAGEDNGVEGFDDADSAAEFIEQRIANHQHCGERDLENYHVIKGRFQDVLVKKVVDKIEIKEL